MGAYETAVAAKDSGKCSGAHIYGSRAAAWIQQGIATPWPAKGVRELASEVQHPYPPSVNGWRWPNKQAAAQP